MTAIVAVKEPDSRHNVSAWSVENKTKQRYCVTQSYEGSFDVICMKNLQVPS